MYDCIIIGGGPAGMSAVVYGVRAGMKVAIFEKLFPGGQLANTSEIENYPGFKEISGVDLAMQMQAHARDLGGDWLTEEVVSIGEEEGVKIVRTDGGTHKAKTLILAMGAKPRLLGVPGEEQFKGKGVSYCATCDGNFYRGKDVAVIGGGNTALEDALFLSRICGKVSLVHRRDQFRGDHILVEKVKQTENIHCVYDSVVKEISGETAVEHIVLHNVKTAAEETLPLNGVFVAVGNVPQSALAKDWLALDGNGYIIADKRLETNIPGVYAAGDVRDTPLRQVVMSAADGALAAFSASLYIASH